VTWAEDPAAGSPGTGEGIQAGARACYLGVDVGGTKIRLGVVTPRGELSRCWESPTPVDENPSETVGRLVSEWRDRRLPATCGIGVAVAAMVSPGGQILAAPHLPAWVGTDIPALFGQHTANVPVSVVFDGAAGILGEAWLRQPPLRDAFMLTIGTGVGGGLLIDGNVVRGAHGLSGMPSGLALAGQPGIEAVASGPGVAAAARAPDGREVTARYRAGDPAAVRAFAHASDALYRAIAAVTAMADVATVLVTGGFGTGAFRCLFPELVLPEKYRSFPLIHNDVKIGIADTGDKATLLGAVRNLMENLPAPPAAGAMRQTTRGEHDQRQDSR
jgi:glucokinase